MPTVWQMLRYRLVAGWIAAASLAAVTYSRLPVTARPSLWPVFSVSAAVLVLVGARVHRVPRRQPAYLLAGAIGLVAIGDVIMAVWGPPGVEPASWLAIIASVVLCMAGLSITRIRLPGGDRGGAIDALIVMVAMAGMLWDSVTAPALTQRLPLDEITAAVALPIESAAVFAAMVRVLLANATRLWSAWALMLAAACSVVANIVVLTNGDLSHPAAKMLWIVAYTAAGAAFLHPHVARMHLPVAEQDARVPYGRLAVLGVALASVPAVMLRDSQVEPGGPPMAILAAMVCIALVLWRIGLLLAELDRSWRELHRRSQRETALASISEGAVGSLTLDELLDRSATKIGNVIDVDHVSLTLAAPRSVSDEHWTVPLATDTARYGELVLDLGEDADLDAGELDFVHAARNLLASAVQRRNVEAEIRHHALHDMLTGLPNRMLLMDRLGNALARMRRGGAAPAVLFIDLDGFKTVNDRYGHPAGDDVLKEIASRLRSLVRLEDTVARLSGDEFVVLCESASLAEGVRVAERAVAVSSQPIAVGSGTAGGSLVTVGASAGVTAAHAGDDVELLIRRADAAMYRAKERGRGRVELAPGPAAPTGVRKAAFGDR